MAFIQCNFYSASLGMATAVNVLLPQTNTKGQIGIDNGNVGGTTPVLYLLHGLSDDYTIWMRRTSIERYATEAGIAVVMPGVARSYYCNTQSGERYWDYVAEELPALMQQFFRISSRREDTFAAGLSMGGYGALKLGLTFPERYAAVAGLSAALRPDTLFVGAEEVYNNNFGAGTEFLGSKFDVYRLAKELAANSSAPRPEIFLCCGQEDFTFGDNVTFHETLNQLGYEHHWDTPHGNHNWAFWDEHIKQVMKWLPTRKAGE